MSKINFEEVSFAIISKSGEAKTFALEAMKMARNKNINEANNLLEQAEKFIGEAGTAHMDVIVEEANGIRHPFSVLFMHAEDQFLTTQTLIILIREMIQMQEEINNLK